VFTTVAFRSGVVQPLGPLPEAAPDADDDGEAADPEEDAGDDGDAGGVEDAEAAGEVAEAWPDGGEDEDEDEEHPAAAPKASAPKASTPATFSASESDLAITVPFMPGPSRPHS
jgi:hypothetical protein